jgi:acyl dehydratase
MATVDVVEHTERCSTVSKEPVTFCSDWFCLTQAQIDAFAAATSDKQWIHQRNAKDTGSPFKAPIAHGLLLVCLAMNLARESGALDDATWVLYGFEKVRFRAPVPSMARIRCLTTICASRDVGGRTLANVRLVVEIQNAKIPAIVADCLLLNFGVLPVISQNEAITFVE